MKRKTNREILKIVKHYDDLKLTAWRDLADAYRLGYRKINSDLRRYGLTQAQYSVLRIIGRSKQYAPAMNEISKDLLVTLADVTLVVDILERRGYLKRAREKGDRRIVRAVLTRSGRSLYRKILSLHKKKIADLMSELTTQELTQLVSCTTKIRNQLLPEFEHRYYIRKPSIHL